MCLIGGFNARRSAEVWVEFLAASGAVTSVICWNSTKFRIQSGTNVKKTEASGGTASFLE